MSPSEIREDLRGAELIWPAHESYVQKNKIPPKDPIADPLSRKNKRSKDRREVTKLIAQENSEYIWSKKASIVSQWLSSPASFLQFGVPSSFMSYVDLTGPFSICLAWGM